MEIKSNITDNKIEVELKGRMDTNTSPEFEEEIYPKLENVNEIEIDMKELDYISSAGLRVILTCQKKMSGVEGKVTIKNLNEIVLEVFKATGFDSIVNIEN